jgi:hypothetical protein
MKVLILGGYGVFGGRLAELLADIEALEIVIAGRSIDKARAFCAHWVGRATVRPLAVDRAEIADVLAQEKPDILVDASGPFQTYGAAPYAVAEAAIAAGVPYLDFADGSDFVFGIGALDCAAKAAEVFVLAGVSSFPVLTSAVLSEMARDMTLRRITGGIAPSPYAGVGMNVMRAVLGYAGQDVRLRRDGREGTGIGLVETRRYTIAPPGRLPLRNIRFSLVDVPDLQVIPAARPEITDLWIGAGPGPEVLHRLLNLLARARHVFHLPNLRRLAPLCYRVLNAMKFGDHRGGMFVEAEGVRNGAPLTRSWHLLAEGDDGPYIPSMAIEAILRRGLAGDWPIPGARAGSGELTLADYHEVFTGRRIETGWREVGTDSAYPTVLGAAFGELPATMQALHRPGTRAVWRGEAEVRRGRSRVAGLVARLFGFPENGSAVPVEVTFTTDAQGRETWARRFGGRLMRSTQEAGTGRDAHLIVERFGPFAFGLALVWDGARLKLIPRHWRVFGLALPRALMPGGDSFERVERGDFRFHVEIRLPVFGEVVTYEGWLKPAATSL